MNGRKNGKKKQRIRVLIGDDHTVVREGLLLLLEGRPDLVVVGEASNGREAVDLWKEHRPDVTLLDLRMPVLDGVGAIKQIREVDPNAHIVVLTTYDGDEDIYRALQAGARAYLLKGMTVEVLVSTIRSVHAGKSCIPPVIAQKLAERMATEQLTHREQDVLEQIVRGKSNKEIGTELDISEATVKTHINNLLSKLGVTDRTQAATAAIQRGLVQLDPQGDIRL